MANINELTVQIVLYEETKELIFDCLENIKNFKILILDNSNNLNLKKQIIEKFNIKEYFIPNKNLGYSKGHNFLSKMVDTKYILILNADCQINEDSIKNLLSSYEKYTDSGILGPTSFDKDFKYTYNGGQSFENENKTEITEISGDTCFQKILGSAMLIEKKLFLEVGMFNENMFLFFSDYDLCKKINRSNKSVIQIRSATSIHTHGKSKVKNIIKRIFLKEFNMTYDQLYYFYINKLENTLLSKLKKQQFNYLFKVISNLIIFKFDKSVYYYSKIIAYYKFVIKN
ncbi:glycosyltransferase [Candidatus Pelagibacter sp.]|nr:glycosyltransferase [Candidatus Pelagibacter sp.]